MSFCILLSPCLSVAVFSIEGGALSGRQWEHSHGVDWVCPYIHTAGLWQLGHCFTLHNRRYVYSAGSLLVIQIILFCYVKLHEQEKENLQLTQFKIV